MGKYLEIIVMTILTPNNPQPLKNVNTCYTRSTSANSLRYILQRIIGSVAASRTGDRQSDMVINLMNKSEENVVMIM